METTKTALEFGGNYRRRYAKIYYLIQSSAYRDVNSVRAVRTQIRFYGTWNYWLLLRLMLFTYQLNFFPNILAFLFQNCRLIGFAWSQIEPKAKSNCNNIIYGLYVDVISLNNEVAISGVGYRLKCVWALFCAPLVEVASSSKVEIIRAALKTHKSRKYLHCFSQGNFAVALFWYSR